MPHRSSHLHTKQLQRQQKAAAKRAEKKARKIAKRRGQSHSAILLSENSGEQRR
jgi:hypothetical protein